MLMLFMAASADQSGRSDDILETYIERIGQNDREALALLYEKTHAAVYGFALSVLKNRQDAEDVVHDTYIQVWKGAAAYQPCGKPLAWMFVIARNLARMRFREQSRTMAADLQKWQGQLEDEPSAGWEDRLILLTLLQSLSDEERQIVVLHAMTGLKHREIAALLELGLPNVLSKYSRAMKKLRKAVKEDDYDKS